METLTDLELLTLCILSSIALFWGLYQFLPLVVRRHRILRTERRVRRLRQKRQEIRDQWDIQIPESRS